MKSLILRTTARFLMPVLVLFSFLTLIRGHNQPGGGFAGGLLAATAAALYIFAWDAPAVRRAVRVDPHLLIGSGLLLALVSGLVSFGFGRTFLTGLWLPFETVTLGTPLLFDLGVYAVVLGSTLMILTALASEEERQRENER